MADPEGPAGSVTSVEFCGGTHLRNAAHLGPFSIVSEEAIAQGRRRIFAVAGEEAERTLRRTVAFENDEKQLVADIKSKLTSEEAMKRLITLFREVSESKRDISYWRREELLNRLNALKKGLHDKEKAGSFLWA